MATKVAVVKTRDALPTKVAGQITTRQKARFQRDQNSNPPMTGRRVAPVRPGPERNRRCRYFCWQLKFPAVSLPTRFRGANPSPAGPLARRISKS